MTRTNRRRRALPALLLATVLLLPAQSHAIPTDGSTLPGARAGAPPPAAAAAGPGVDLLQGAATQEIPVAVPPGTGGMAPQLALRYSSAARADSWVGFGWALGLPSVARSLRDGTPVYDDAVDGFTFAGEQLVPESPDTALPRRYRTRRESFLRVIHEADGTWTVTRPDGTLLRFGCDAGSRVERSGGIPFEWLLCEQEDVRGNALAVAWDRRDPGTAYPAEIRYTLRRNGAALTSLGGDPARDRVVSFSLEPRPDAPVSYLAGLERRLGHRLASIDVHAAGVLFRRYELVYTQSPDSGRTLLAEVREHGADAGSPAARAPRVWRLDYHSNDTAGTAGWAMAPWTWPASLELTQASGEDTGTRLADMDGDGLPDLVKALGVVAPDGTITRTGDSGVYRNTGAGFASTPEASFEASWPAMAGVTGNTVPLALAWRFEAQGVTWGNGGVLADLTGDGRADTFGAVGVPPPDNVTPPQHVSQAFELPWCESTGNGFSCLATFPDDFYVDGHLFTGKQGLHWSSANDPLGLFSAAGFAYYGGNTQLGDLDGDGLADLVVRGTETHLSSGALAPPFDTCERRSLHEYVVYNLGGLAFAQAGLDPAELPDTCPAGGQVRSFDFAVCADAASAGELADCARRTYFNGSELITTSSFPGFWWTHAAHAELGTRVADLNADGLADLASATDDQGTLWTFAGLNDGARGFREVPAWTLPAAATRLEAMSPSPYGLSPPVHAWMPWESRDLGVRLADVNGDGRVDVVAGAEGGAAAIWLGDGDGANGASDPGDTGAWRTATAWALPAGLAFVNAAGQDLGLRLLDVDGDGMTDLVRSHGGTNEVYLNQGSPPDLLVSVTTPLGATTSLEYTPSTAFDHSGNDGIPDLPQVLQLLSRIETNDGFGNVTASTFDYEGGLYDPAERELRGFAVVTRFHLDFDGATVLRETRTAHHQDAARAGLVAWEEIYDGDGVLLAVTEHAYTPDADGPPWVSLLERSDRLEVDGAATPRRSRVELAYDAHGNVTLRRELGEVVANGVSDPGTDVDPSDTRETQIFYAPPNDALHLVNLPVWQQLLDGSGAVVSQSIFFYDGATTIAAVPTRGELTKRVDVLAEAGSADPTTAYAYDAYGNVTSVTDPRANDPGDGGGGTTAVEYDGIFHTFPVRVVNALGHATESDTAPDVLCAAEAAADPSLGIFPGHGPGAGLEHQVRDPNALAAEDPGTLRCFDAFGRLVLERAPGDLGETRIVHDDAPATGAVDGPSPSVTRLERANAAGSWRFSTTTLDGLGRAVGSLSAGAGGRSVVTATGYDALGRVASQVRPHFATEATPDPTTTAYDALGRVLAVTRPGAGGARTTTFAHDRGRTTVTDPVGSQRVTAQDALGRIRTVEEHEGSTVHTTTYAYDARDLLVRLEDTQGNVTLIGYDALGRRRSLDDPDTGSTTYAYDAAGNPTLQTGPLGSVAWEYDALGRRTEERVAAPGAPEALTAAWTHDGAPGGIGRQWLRLEVPASRAAQILAYDLAGRATGEKVVEASVHHTFQTTYDHLGQRATRTDPTGRTRTWVRDDAGYLTAISSTGPDGTAGTTYASAIDWDARGRLAAWTSGGGVTTTLARDPETDLLDEIQVARASALDRVAFQWDAADRVTAVTDLLDDTRSRSFTYDALSRLVSATGPWGADRAQTTLHYAYDALGNITCRGASSADAGCPGGRRLAYPAPAPAPGVERPHAPLTVDGAAVTHDAAGNLTNVGTRAYGYDVRGRLVRATLGTKVRSLAYDGTGRLASFTVGSATTHLLTDGFEWHPGSKEARLHVRLAGTVIASHTVAYDPAAPAGAGIGGLALLLLLGLPPLVWVGRRTQLHGAGAAWRGGVALATTGAVTGMLLVPQAPFPGATGGEAHAGRRRAWTPPPDLLYLHGDHLGSAAVLTTADGTLYRRNLYRPYGGAVPAVGTGTVWPGSDWGFTGQRFVAGAGLYHFGARFYDPDLGRFVQPDPVVPDPGRGVALNRYAYVYDNPTNLVDPTGHWPSFVDSALSWASDNLFQPAASFASGFASSLSSSFGGGGWSGSGAAFGAGSLLGGGLGSLAGIGAGALAAPFGAVGAMLGELPFGLGRVGSPFRAVAQRITGFPAAGAAVPRTVGTMAAGLGRWLGRDLRGALGMPVGTLAQAVAAPYLWGRGIATRDPGTLRDAALTTAGIPTPKYGSTTGLGWSGAVGRMLPGLANALRVDDPIDGMASPWHDGRRIFERWQAQAGWIDRAWTGGDGRVNWSDVMAPGPYGQALRVFATGAFASFAAVQWTVGLDGR